MTAGLFPDVESLLADLLVDIGGSGAQTGTATPDDLQAQLPFIRINAHGGPRDQVNSVCRFRTHTLAATYAEAKALDAVICQRLIASFITLSGVTLDRVECTEGPDEVAWPDPGVRRVVSTYKSVARRRTS